MLEKDQNTVLDHELSHAFYFLSKEYKDFVDAEVGKLSKRAYKSLHKELEASYNPSVFDDEIVAYVISGFLDNLKKIPNKIKRRIRKKFYEELKKTK